MDEQRDGAALGRCMTALRQQQEKECGFNWSIQALRIRLSLEASGHIPPIPILRTQSAPGLWSLGFPITPYIWTVFLM